MPASVGREAVLVLLESYRTARRRGVQRLGTDLILALFARDVLLGKKAHLSKQAASAIRRVAAQKTSVAVDTYEQSTSVDRALQEEVDATLREVAWRAVHQFGGQARMAASSSPAWTGAVCDALGHALVTAEAQSAPYTGTAHLLAGLLADAGNDASALLRSAGLEPAVVADQLRADQAERAGAEPYAPLIASLEFTGGLVVKESPILRLIQAPLRRRIARRNRYGSAVLACLEQEMMRQAVRTGSEIVTPAHALLAIISLDCQLSVTGKFLVAQSAPFNQGAVTLHRLSIDFPRTLAVLKNTTDAGASAAVEDPSRRFWKIARPTWSVEVSSQLDRAVDMAHQRGHPEAGTSHLLDALLEDETGTAARLLQRLGADIAEVRDEVHRALSSATPRRS